MIRLLAFLLVLVTNIELNAATYEALLPEGNDKIVIDTSVIITGSVLDSIHKNALEAATVIIWQEDQIITGGATNSEGKFHLPVQDTMMYAFPLLVEVRYVNVREFFIVSQPENNQLLMTDEGVYLRCLEKRPGLIKRIWREILFSFEWFPRKI